MTRLSRRDFLVGAGAVSGAAMFAGCGGSIPPASRSVRRIGFLGTPQSAEASEGFAQALRELGYVDGQNITIHWQIADEDTSELPRKAVELTSLPVDLIVASGSPAVRAAQQTTSTIPIVMASTSDPVGLVEHPVHPGP